MTNFATFATVTLFASAVVVYMLSSMAFRVFRDLLSLEQKWYLRNGFIRFYAVLLSLGWIL